MGVPFTKLINTLAVDLEKKKADKNKKERFELTSLKKSYDAFLRLSNLLDDF